MATEIPDQCEAYTTSLHPVSHTNEKIRGAIR